MVKKFMDFVEENKEKGEEEEKKKEIYK